MGLVAPGEYHTWRTVYKTCVCSHRWWKITTQLTHNCSKVHTTPRTAGCHSVIFRRRVLEEPGRGRWRSITQDGCWGSKCIQTLSLPSHGCDWLVTSVTLAMLNYFQLQFWIGGLGGSPPGLTHVHSNNKTQTLSLSFSHIYTQ